MNIARPKGEKGGDRGGRGGGRGGGGGGGRRNDVEGAKLFVHNVSEETSQEDLRGAFENHGTVTDAYNPGKGFAFITFSSPDEAQAAIKAMDGTYSATWPSLGATLEVVGVVVEGAVVVVAVEE